MENQQYRPVSVVTSLVEKWNDIQRKNGYKNPSIDFGRWFFENIEELLNLEKKMLCEFAEEWYDENDASKEHGVAINYDTDKFYHEVYLKKLDEKEV